MSYKSMPPWHQTLGHHVYVYENPELSAINLKDISHSLALTNRFNGHTLRPLSVAEHSIGVASMVPKEICLEALMHDAAEAYVGDMAAPLKHLCPGYVEIESIAHEAIANRFGLDRKIMECDAIKHADLNALVTEREVLKAGSCADWEVDGSYNEGYAYDLRRYKDLPWWHWRNEWLTMVTQELRHRESPRSKKSKPPRR